jgi:hypothetical protein
VTALEQMGGEALAQRVARGAKKTRTKQTPTFKVKVALAAARTTPSARRVGA